MDDALAQGATACLPKPFTPEALATLVQAIERGERRAPPYPGDVRQLQQRDMAKLAALSSDELDALPFGAVRINHEGRVTAFNDYEAEASQRAPRAVLGMRFADLAPCTEVQEFVSAVTDGFRRRHMDRVLRFVFPYRRAACVVAVRLYYDAGFEQMWIFISAARGKPRLTSPAQ
jgi:photoactive yellow protein